MPPPNKAFFFRILPHSQFTVVSVSVSQLKDQSIQSTLSTQPHAIDANMMEVEQHRDVHHQEEAEVEGAVSDWRV